MKITLKAQKPVTTPGGFRNRRLARALKAVAALACVIAPVVATTESASASTPDPSAWVGSPITGTWPDSQGCAGAGYPSTTCSLPWVHHVTYTSVYDWGTGANDWAADLQGVVPNATPVVFYAAPQNTAQSLSARVEAVAPACGSGRISDGGYRVQVGMYINGVKIGTATYAHINPTVAAGQWINRWGTRIGTVGNYNLNDSNKCWTGAHVHVELSSRHNYSCYSGVFQGTPWRIGEHDFIGFVGGNYAGGPRQRCP
jgi:hypothetical protein